MLECKWFYLSDEELFSPLPEGPGKRVAQFVLKVRRFVRHESKRWKFEKKTTVEEEFSFFGDSRRVSSFAPGHTSTSDTTTAPSYPNLSGTKRTPFPAVTNPSRRNPRKRPTVTS